MRATRSLVLTDKACSLFGEHPTTQVPLREHPWRPDEKDRMKVVQCDNCGATAKGEYVPPTWLNVDTEAITYGVERGPWHFDTFLCMAEWATKRGAGVT